MAFLKLISLSLLASSLLLAQYDRMDINSRVSCGTYNINSPTYKIGSTMNSITCSAGSCVVALTSQPHIFVGANITINNSSTSSMNGTFPVKQVSLPSIFNFVYWNAAAPNGTYTDAGMTASATQLNLNGAMSNSTVFNTTNNTIIRLPIFTLLLNQKVLSAVITNMSSSWTATNLTGVTVSLGSNSGTDDTAYWKPYPTGTSLAPLNLFSAFNSGTSLPNVSKINTGSDAVNLVFTGTFSSGNWSNITDLNGLMNAYVCVLNFN